MEQFVFVGKELAEQDVSKSDVGLIQTRMSDRVSVLLLRENRVVELSADLVVIFDPAKTGDEHEFKVCDRCFKHLETKTEFENNRIKKHGKITKRPSCRACRKTKNGRSVSSADRALWKEAKPRDFTPFQCPICQKTSIIGITNIDLDHCHRTGRVRGWICGSCNTGIGRFDDDPAVIERAIKWLREN